MSLQDEAEQLRVARRILNLRDDAERAEIEAHIARMRADTEAAIAASRPSIRQALRENLEVQEDYDEERRDGWALEPTGNPFS